MSTKDQVKNVKTVAHSVQNMCASVKGSNLVALICHQEGKKLAESAEKRAQSSTQMTSNLVGVSV